MIDEEILYKSIEKAKKNGFNFDEYNNYSFSEAYWITPINYYETIIFSHDFAKAFWGRGKDITNCVDNCNKISSCQNCSGGQLKWQFHLQQMVLKKEPLKYLVKFLDNEE